MIGASRARALWPALALAGAGIAVLVVASISFQGSRGYGYDFAAYDSAARRLVSGMPLYLADTAQRYASGAYEGLYLYPPPLAVALLPFTALSTDGATLAWFVGRIAALAIGCLILPVALRIRLSLFGVACATYPVLFDLNLGNVSVVTFALTAVAWRASGAWPAAIAHAALVAIRQPFGIFLVMWAARGDVRRVAMTMAAGLVLFAVTLPVVGFATYLEFLTILRSLPDITTGPHNLSLKSTLLAISAPESVSSLAVPIGAALALGASVVASRRRDDAVAIVVTAMATMLVSPFLHPHYLALSLLPAALLADRGRRWGLLLPLAGWLPDPILPLVPIAAIAAVLALPVSSPAASAASAASAAPVRASANTQ